MKQNAPKRWPGILIALLFAVALSLFVVILSATLLIPGKYLLALCGVLLPVVLCVLFLAFCIWHLQSTFTIGNNA